MKTSVMEVHDMLSVLSVLGVEKRIGEVAGVKSVTVNYAAGNATVRYDEARLDIAGIKSTVRQMGYQSDGDSQPGQMGEHQPAGQDTVVPKPEAAAVSMPPVAAPATAAGDRQPGKANGMAATPVAAEPK